MKLNVGCGRMVLEGYVNVDIVQNPKAPRPPEFVGVGMDNLDAVCADGEASEILAIHVIEHVYQWEVEPILAHWFAKLRSGGALVIEAPDVRKCALSLLNDKPEQMSMWGFYGDPGHRDPFMTHRWGWTSATISKILTRVGFLNLSSEAPIHHGRRIDRDFRVVARKP